MIGVRRDAAPVNGLGRRVEPNTQLVEPRLQECVRAAVSDDERTVTLSFMRPAGQGLHSVSVQYGSDEVRFGVRLGSRPEFSGQPRSAVLRMVYEHTAVRLREPIRGRRLELVLPRAEVSRSS